MSDGGSSEPLCKLGQLVVHGKSKVRWFAGTGSYCHVTFCEFTFVWSRLT